MIADKLPVVVTRPQQQGAALAAEILAAGRAVCYLPLLQILPLDDAGEISRLQQTLRELANYSLVAFVSPNAIEACFQQLQALKLTWPRTTAIAVMGQGSRDVLAKILADQGVLESEVRIFAPRNRQQTDSETLLQELDLAQLRQAKVLIMRGQTGREFLFDALHAAGVQAEQLACYRRLPPQVDAASLQNLATGLQTPHHWLITSSEALRNLLELTQTAPTALRRLAVQASTACGGAPCRSNLPKSYLCQLLEQIQLDTRAFPLGWESCVAKMKQQHLIVPHRRIAQTAQALGFRHVTQCAAGDVGMLAALQSLP